MSIGPHASVPQQEEGSTTVVVLRNHESGSSCDACYTARTSHTVGNGYFQNRLVLFQILSLYMYNIILLLLISVLKPQYIIDTSSHNDTIQVTIEAMFMFNS